MYGKKVAVVEMTPFLGGTCVNVGTHITLNYECIRDNNICLSMERLRTQESKLISVPLIPFAPVNMIRYNHVLSLPEYRPFFYSLRYQLTVG
jgi:hypothetical protein